MSKKNNFDADKTGLDKTGLDKTGLDKAGDASAVIENADPAGNKGEPKKEEPFKYSITPALTINMVRESRIYRFEMPIGANLNECVVACAECLNIVKKMLEEADAKRAESETRESQKEEAEKAKNPSEESVSFEYIDGEPSSEASEE